MHTLDRINILGDHIETWIFILFLISGFVRGLNSKTVMDNKHDTKSISLIFNFSSQQCLWQHDYHLLYYNQFVLLALFVC